MYFCLSKVSLTGYSIVLQFAEIHFSCVASAMHFFYFKEEVLWKEFLSDLSLHYGRALKEEREKRNMTITDISEKTGPEKYLVFAIENEEVLPKYQHIKKIADIIGVDLWTLTSKYYYDEELFLRRYRALKSEKQQDVFDIVSKYLLEQANERFNKKED